jgi:hypothetical protein
MGSFLLTSVVSDHPSLPRDVIQVIPNQIKLFIWTYSPIFSITYFYVKFLYPVALDPAHKVAWALGRLCISAVASGQQSESRPSLDNYIDLYNPNPNPL